MTGQLRYSSVLLLACTLLACGKRADPPEPRFEAKSGATSAPARAPAAPLVEVGDSGAAQSAIDASTLDAGSDAGAVDDAQWAEFTREDDVPLCVFGSYEDIDKVQFLKDVPNTATLRLNDPIFFGVFGPDCNHEACLRRALLQCWLDVEGNDIFVHTRYSAQRKVGAKCTKDCEPATADCRTLSLPPGTYNVHYAGITRKLTHPGVVRPACLKR